MKRTSINFASSWTRAKELRQNDLTNGKVFQENEGCSVSFSQSTTERYEIKIFLQEQLAKRLMEEKCELSNSLW